MSGPDGGPAFPSPLEWREEEIGDGRRGVFDNAHDGMSLRDFFAAKAMASMVAGQGARMVADRDGRYDGTNWKQVVAANAYEFADAMLAERNKSK